MGTPHLASRRPDPIRLGLALPGGGVLGCFTYGVLTAFARHAGFQDKLDNGDITIALVSGTSAGAAQGAILTAALNIGHGFAGAARGLVRLWANVHDAGRCNPLRMMGFNGALPAALDTFMTAMSPSGLVPAWIAHTTQNIVGDWRAVSHGPIPLQVNAVRVQRRNTAEHVVFTGDTLTPHAIAASTALTRFGGYRIGNDTYFDGGYYTNPHMDGFAAHGVTDLLVLPLCAPSPCAMRSTFMRHSSMTKPAMGEIYADLQRLRHDAPAMRQHVIALTPDAHWDDTAPMNNSRHFMHDLQNRGFETAQAWLEQHLDALGQRDSAMHSGMLAEEAETRYPVRYVVVSERAVA